MRQPFILIALFSLHFVALGCSSPDPQLKITISYVGKYHFSKPAHLKIEFLEHTQDGPTLEVGTLSFFLTHLPQTLNVRETPIPLEQWQSLRSTIESYDHDLRFTTFRDQFRPDQKILDILAREDLGFGYNRDSTGVYTLNTKIPDCDPKTFSFISTDGLYVRDQTRVYRRFRIVEGAEAGSFTVIDGAYQKDFSKIFYDGTHLVEADRDTFEVYPTLGFARDKSAIYSAGHVITGADRSSFEPLDRYYSRDIELGYHGHEAISGSHGRSFRLVEGNSGYAADNRFVFYGKKQLEGADPSKFRPITLNIQNQPIPGVYATDGSLVFFQGDLITGADAASFQVEYVNFGGNAGPIYLARDKNRRYSGKDSYQELK